ncbi:putative Prefoldin subunit 5 [Hypsibius exemplaris]|uniref:Prefoldin subunit 5 n=1 Tax=Hypsibius exemplaris TaxID=2072580 RepID=A0A9X6NGH6_HYPEX|nr:putative Prefoldin subunit 5 [Hypsibius exemplaris]
MASTPAGDPRQQQAIGLQELQHIKQRFEQEMNVLTDSIQKLQMIQQHFLASQENSKQMESVPDGSECLVPLCDGLLVRGKAIDVATVLVDIGAGYFVEMTQEKSREYCKRRIDFLTTQLLTLQENGPGEATAETIYNGCHAAADGANAAEYRKRSQCRTIAAAR